MTLFDSLLSARDAIDAWLVANPEPSGARLDVFEARQQLGQAMNTAVGIDLEAALAGLVADTQDLQACTDRLTKVARTINTAAQIVADVGIVVQVLAQAVAAAAAV